MIVAFDFRASRPNTKKLRCSSIATDSYNAVVSDHCIFHVISISDTIISVCCLISSLDTKELKDEKVTISNHEPSLVSK